MIDLLELKEWHESQKRQDDSRQGRARTTAPFAPPTRPAPDDSDLKPFGSEYIPTPETIRQRCLEIQAEWTSSERRRRTIGEPRPEQSIRVHRLWAPHAETAEIA